MRQYMNLVNNLFESNLEEERLDELTAEGYLWHGTGVEQAVFIQFGGSFDGR